ATQRLALDVGDVPAVGERFFRLKSGAMLGGCSRHGARFLLEPPGFVNAPVRGPGVPRRGALTATCKVSRRRNVIAARTIATYCRGPEVVHGACARSRLFGLSSHGGGRGVRHQSPRDPRRRLRRFGRNGSV